MTYHVILKTERRALDGVRPLATSFSDQLHMTAAEVNRMDNIAYCAEWDGRSPWITVHKGLIADLKLGMAGWPMVTQAEWEAAQPKKVLTESAVA